MTDTYVLDAWAILALLQREEPAASRVREILALGEGQEALLLLSMINLGEVYYQVGKRVGATRATQALSIVRNLPLTLVSATDDLVLQAAGLKMRHLISYADAFAVGLALREDALLVTGDLELRQLRTEVRIEMLERFTSSSRT